MTPIRGRVLDVARDEVDRWCRVHVGEAVEEELFRSGYLSTVVGVRLRSGKPVVVKIRRPARRLAACAVVHRILHQRGFPCPEPLVESAPFGDLVASAEVMVAGGGLFPDSGRAPGPFADALARLVSLAPRPTDVGPLDPPLPWTPPDQTTAELWPKPDDRDIDLNRVEGPAWIDDAGRAARERIDRCGADLVVGHGDWYTANLRWAGSRLHAAFDWDSVIAAPEPVVVGLAAAVFPATRVGTEATVEETEAFLSTYSSARAGSLGTDELQVAWAAGLWNRAFDAKKQFATERRPRSLTEAEALERRERAGAGA